MLSQKMLEFLSFPGQFCSYFRGYRISLTFKIATFPMCNTWGTFKSDINGQSNFFLYCMGNVATCYKLRGKSKNYNFAQAETAIHNPQEQSMKC